MNIRTRTAPAKPAEAVAREMKIRRAEARRLADRMLAEAIGPVTYKPDFGSITREEMRAIVIDMIG